MGLSDDGLKLVSDSQHCGRLLNSELLSNIDEHLSYLPEGQRDEVINLVQSHPTLFNDVPSCITLKTAGS